MDLQTTQVTFDSIKRFDEFGNEYWSARELMKALGYAKWQNFEEVLKKAVTSIRNAQKDSNYWLTESSKPIISGKGVCGEYIDYKLSRYECYIVAQCGDAKKIQIAQAQTYFAQKARQQELFEEVFEQLTEDEKRLAIRQEVKNHNKSLHDAAYNAGVRTGYQFANFNNAGYKGLYGGLTEDDIHARKGLDEKERILDHMGSTELAANLFRATQTDEKLRKDRIQGAVNANNVHFQVGQAVRKTIEEIGGTMPENLPTPEKSIQEIEKEKKKFLKNGNS